MTILDKILEAKREEVKIRKNTLPYEKLMDMSSIERKGISMRLALEKSATGIIAEFKRKSPSKGYIHENAKVEEVVKGYAENGAAACSILTDIDFFGGNPEDLKSARSLVDIPLLRKDFIVDEYQLAEAKAWRADAVLLIAAVLPKEKCNELAEKAHNLGLEVLLEVHSKEELDWINPHIDMVGVNNRNLATFKTDIYTSFELAELIPHCYTKVAESGINSFETVLALKEVGYKGFLIGERFMREENPPLALKNFIENVD